MSSAADFLTSSQAEAPPSPWQAYWRKVLHFDRGRLEPWLALRNTAGVVSPLVAGIMLGMPRGGLAVATGALQVSYSDGHDSYRRRAQRMVGASVLCALAVVAGGLAGSHPALTVLVPALWACAAGLAVALGPTADNLGVISLVMLIIYAAQPLTPEKALLSGWLALGGGLLQTGLSLALWPVRRYAPERSVIASLYRSLSQAATQEVGASGAPPASEQSTIARETLIGLGNDHRVEAERYWSLLNQAERIRLSLLALRRLRKRMERSTESQASTEHVQRFLGLAAETLEALSQALQTSAVSQTVSDRLRDLENLADAFRNEEETNSPILAALRRDARFQMDALVGQLRSAARTATETTPAGEEALAARAAVDPWQHRVQDGLAKLRANLTPQSSVFRHAVRMAVCVAIGEIVAHAMRSQRSYWLAMTIVLVLKPEFAATFSRGVLRIAGTILGLLLATALFHFLPPGAWTEVILVGLFAFLLRWLGPANYGVFTVSVSALIVALVTLTGLSPRQVILARGEMTCLGGLIALAAYIVWPTWERTQVSELLASLLDCYRDYFHGVVEGYRRGSLENDTELDRKRMVARLARSNLEASADRMRAEPGTRQDQITLLSAILANSHRFVRATMALEVVPLGTKPVSEAFFGFAHDVEKTLELLSSALRGTKVREREFPDLREDHRRLQRSADSATERYALVIEETDRMTNSLNTLSEQVMQWLQLQSAQNSHASPAVNRTTESHIQPD